MSPGWVSRNRPDVTTGFRHAANRIRAFDQQTPAAPRSSKKRSTDRSVGNIKNRPLHDPSTARASAHRIPAMDELEQRIREALAAGRLAWLRRALTSYLARECRALVS